MRSHHPKRVKMEMTVTEAKALRYMAEIGMEAIQAGEAHSPLKQQLAAERAHAILSTEIVEAYL